MLKLFHNIPLHTLILSIYPIVFLLAENPSQISKTVGMIALYVLLLTYLVWWILSKIFHKSKKVDIFVSLILVLFFSYGHAYKVFEFTKIGSFAVGTHTVLLITWGLLFILGSFFIIKQKQVETIDTFFNIFSVFLISFSIIKISHYILTPSTQNVSESEDYEISEQQNKPDIYYIILDGHEADSTSVKLHNTYSLLVDFLNEKGFFVATASTSNYTQTTLSLSSSLNMKYINQLSSTAGQSVNKEIYSLIKNNQVQKFLKQNGYHYIHFSSGWLMTDTNQFANTNVECGNLNEFGTVLFQTTVLLPFKSFLITDDLRARTLCIFDQLPIIATKSGPKFVFAHILSPHPPYLFGKNGEKVEQKTLVLSGESWQYHQNYLDQQQFIDEKAITTINQIIANSKTTPIIIVQSDHGSALTFDKAGEGNWIEPNSLNLNERMRILNAFLVPDDVKKQLYADVTPVNSFRIIFNTVFGANFELLPDINYYTNYDHPYDFVDVTSKLKKNNHLIGW